MEWWTEFVTGALVAALVTALLFSILIRRAWHRSAEWEQSAMDLDKELRDLQKELRP